MSIEESARKGKETAEALEELKRRTKEDELTSSKLNLLVFLLSAGGLIAWAFQNRSK